MKVVDVMGSAKLQEYMKKYQLNMPKQLVKLVKNTDEVPLEAFVNMNNHSRVTKDALDLLR